MMTNDPITLEIIEGPSYSRDADGWEHHAYTVELRRTNHRPMRVPWRQGLGITDDPDPARVLEALLSDAATVNNARSFEEWAADLGYDPDSRKAEGIYKAARKQTDQLCDLLGDDYLDAVFPTEADDFDHERVVKRLVNA